MNEFPLLLDQGLHDRMGKNSTSALKNCCIELRKCIIGTNANKQMIIFSSRTSESFMCVSGKDCL